MIFSFLYTQKLVESSQRPFLGTRDECFIDFGTLSSCYSLLRQWKQMRGELKIWAGKFDKEIGTQPAVK